MYSICHNAVFRNMYMPSVFASLYLQLTRSLFNAQGLVFSNEEFKPVYPDKCPRSRGNTFNSKSVEFAENIFHILDEIDELRRVHSV